jgi:hypothetical protein
MLTKITPKQIPHPKTRNTILFTNSLFSGFAYQLIIWLLAFFLMLLTAESNVAKKMHKNNVSSIIVSILLQIVKIFQSFFLFVC